MAISPPRPSAGRYAAWDATPIRPAIIGTGHSAEERQYFARATAVTSGHPATKIAVRARFPVFAAKSEDWLRQFQRHRALADRMRTPPCSRSRSDEHRVFPRQIVEGGGGSALPPAVPPTAASRLVPAVIETMRASAMNSRERPQYAETALAPQSASCRRH